MLHAKILRSTIPHGRIRSIDMSAAASAPRVFRAVTGENIAVA
jgi:CO/xanthine dehydrogenase Mo-binding subunit